MRHSLHIAYWLVLALSAQTQWRTRSSLLYTKPASVWVKPKRGLLDVWMNTMHLFFLLLSFHSASGQRRAGRGWRTNWGERREGKRGEASENDPSESLQCYALRGFYHAVDFLETCYHCFSPTQGLCWCSPAYRNLGSLSFLLIEFPSALGCCFCICWGYWFATWISINIRSVLLFRVRPGHQGTWGLQVSTESRWAGFSSNKCLSFGLNQCGFCACIIIFIIQLSVFVFTDTYRCA